MCGGIWGAGMVHAEEVTRSFGGVKALDGVSLFVGPGEVFGLLGPNGAGKTTLVRILSGVLRPDGGRAWVAGLEVAKEPEGVKARIGYATQEASVYRDLTMEENLLFRARLYRPKEVQALAREALERFGLLPYAKTLAGNLSGGWRQRLALAQAQARFLFAPGAALEEVRGRAGVLEAWPSGEGVRLIARKDAPLGEGFQEVAPSLRGVMLKGVGFSVLWPHLVALALFSGLVLFLASVRFQRQVAV